MQKHINGYSKLKSIYFENKDSTVVKGSSVQIQIQINETNWVLKLTSSKLKSNTTKKF